MPLPKPKSGYDPHPETDTPPQACLHPGRDREHHRGSARQPAAHQGRMGSVRSAHPATPAVADGVAADGMSPKDRARHEDRLRDYHADLPLVNTPTIQKVISTGRLLIQLNRRQISARRGMVISGMSGTGKTTALTQLGRAHELAIRLRFPDDGDRLPVIYVTVPTAGDTTNAGRRARQL